MAGFDKYQEQRIGRIAGGRGAKACIFGVLISTLLAGRLPGAEGTEVRLLTLDPGHFHAALFQKEMLPGIAPTVHVYAPLGPDLLTHLGRIAHFNQRAVGPTSWRMEVHTGPDFLERMLEERRGNVVVISGRNQGKISRIAACVRAGLHVLADKPWIIEPEDLGRLEEALETAETRSVVAYDAMTQRFEITCLLQRELVNDAGIFGTCQMGSPEEPAVYLESVHYLLKEVAGVPSLRPAWFFDIRQQGEGMADAGTHLADLVQWTLHPDQAIDYRRDIRLLQGRHWPVMLTRAQFQRVSGEQDFPAYLKGTLRVGELAYWANTSVQYTLRGVHVKLETRWKHEATATAKDSSLAIYRGSRSRVEVRQGLAEGFRPEVFVVPNQPEQMSQVRGALTARVGILRRAYPGLDFKEEAGRLRLLVPDRHRVSHEDHFGLLTRQFLDYVKSPGTLPAWEKPNMLAKYFVTTGGVKLARHNDGPEPITTKTENP